MPATPSAAEMRPNNAPPAWLRCHACGFSDWRRGRRRQWLLVEGSSHGHCRPTSIAPKCQGGSISSRASRSNWRASYSNPNRSRRRWRRDIFHSRSTERFRRFCHGKILSTCRRRCSRTPSCRYGWCGRCETRRAKTERSKSTRCRMRDRSREQGRDRQSGDLGPFDAALITFKGGQRDGIGTGAARYRPRRVRRRPLPRSADRRPAARGARSGRPGQTYCEITPSDTGLRIIDERRPAPRCTASRPVPNANGMTVESYRRCERYITVTGNVLPGVPDQIADGDALLDQTVARLDAAAQAGQGARGGEEGQEAEKAEARPRRHHQKRRRRPLSPAIVPPRCGG